MIRRLHSGASSSSMQVGMGERADTPVLPRERVGGPRNEGERICHIVLPDDPDTALCGKDVTGWPWNPPWPVCVVCADLMEGLKG